MFGHPHDATYAAYSQCCATIAQAHGPWATIRDIWNAEIARYDDRPILVGTLLMGIGLLVVGVWVARLVSNLLGKRLVANAGGNTASSIAFQRVIYYALLAAFTLLALNLLQVPLTVFTVMGGALAIGVGFGAQNIINNFISGWILLAERQVNIGDLVEVEGSLGHVKSIGARCTNVRQPDGIDLLIPNSQLLERTVVNWTLHDSNIRTTVRVGVVYGSPTDKVASLIRTTVDEHDKVLRHPEPIVIFEDFGDNALIFDVYFWVYTTAEMELRRVRSDIRHTLDRLFNAAGIVIAFPQRDLHLDTTRPLEFRMLPETPAQEASTEDTAPLHPDVSLLRGIALFQSMTREDLVELAEGATRRVFHAGEAVVTQGNSGESLFVLTTGLCRVSVEQQGRSRKVGQILPGQFLGEMSLMTGEPRTATVIAVIDSVLFEIDHDLLAPILQRRPEMVRQLSKTLAERRLAMDASLTQGPQRPTQDRSNLARELRTKIRGFFGIREE